MYRTDNPLADFDQWEQDKERQLRKRPKCAFCRHPITDEYAFRCDGGLICEECLNKYFREVVDVDE